MKRVFIADAEPNVRSALHLLLSDELGLEVMGQADRAQGLLDQIQAARSDLLLLDWELPGPSPAELLVGLRNSNGQSEGRPVVAVLSTRREAKPLALAAGADAFACKADLPERLLADLRALAQGRPTKLFVEDGRGL